MTDAKKPKKTKRNNKSESTLNDNGGDYMMDNYNWLSKQDLSKYEGEWIIIARKSIVAHGQNLEKLYTEIDKKYPGEDRITLNVPKKGVYVL